MRREIRDEEWARSCGERGVTTLVQLVTDLPFAFEWVGEVKWRKQKATSVYRRAKRVWELYKKEGRGPHYVNENGYICAFCLQDSLHKKRLMYWPMLKIKRSKKGDER